MNWFTKTMFLGGWVVRWMKASLTIAQSDQKLRFKCIWLFLSSYFPVVFLTPASVVVIVGDVVVGANN